MQHLTTKHWWLGAVCAVALCGAAPSAFATRASLASSGFVVDSAGTPLTGTQTMSFSLYAADTGGTALWTEAQTVTFTSGVYSVMLGKSTALPDDLTDSNEALYLGVTVGSDSEMTPRVEYALTPWARLADRADVADTLASGAATTAAGAGLSATSGVFAIGAGSGITVADDSVALNTGTALTWTAAQTYSAQLVATGTPASTTSAAATMYLNPSSVPANAKVLAVASASADLLTVDAEGDVVIGGNVTIGGTLNGSAVGDVQSLTAGAGLTGGGSSGDLSLAIGAGNAITVNADDVAVTTNSINEDELSATITLANLDFLDLALMTHATTALQGFRLPQIGAAPASPLSGEGFVGWDQTNNLVKVYTGSAWAAVGDTLGSAIASSEITDGEIVNDDISGSAAIAYSKLNLTGALLSADVTNNTLTTDDLNAALTFTDGDIVDLSPVNASSTTEGLKLPQATNVSASTAEGQIAWDTDNDILYVGDGTAALAINGFSTAIETGEITNGTIINEDVSGSAAIAYSKLNLATSIVNADVSASAAIAYSKLAFSNNIVAGDIATGAVATAEILDATIAMADIDSTATLAADPALSANGYTFGTTGWIYEGATANGFEGVLTAADATADRTWTLPDASGTLLVAAGASIVNDDINASAAIAYSKLSLTGSIVAGDLGTGAVTTTGILDGTIIPSDFAATTLAGNPALTAGQVQVDTADSQGGLLFEGATANGFEGLLTPTEPTADRTWTLPDASGTVLLASGTQTLALTNTATAVTPISTTMTTTTHQVTGVQVVLTQSDGSATSNLNVAFYGNVTGNDADATTSGLMIDFQNGSGNAAGMYPAGLGITNDESTAGSMTDGINISATSNGAITDGVDVSDAEITNALNAGANPIVGTTLALNPTASLEINMPDNVAAGLVIQEGGTDYINVSTTNGQEVTTFGKPVFFADGIGIYLGSGQDAGLAFDGTDDRIEVTSLLGKADLYLEDRLILGRQTVATGGENTFTLHATTNDATTDPLTATYVELDGSDADTDVIVLSSTTCDAAVEEGTILILANVDGTHSFVIDQTATTLLDGGADVTLTRDDVMMLVCTGSVWLQVGKVSANS